MQDSHSLMTVVTFVPMACGISFQRIENSRFQIFPEML
ncbi:hypothetical protein SAMN05414139_10225 [Burkholderia sp. D7]|jgi:hypothetical protein|nr:hypothetical protein SAMN05414139_10225 [Burkholderia sp. D7]